MVVWGGFHSSNGYALRTGGSYDPTVDAWTALTTTDALARWASAV
jgi:hypothetical protein